MRELLWNNSLQSKMVKAFIITSVIPLFLVMIFSYVNTAQIVKDNSENFNQTSLEQTRNSLNVWLDSYEDILFQIYMNDDIVDMVRELNQGKDTTLISGQLRRTLRGMFYTKEYIKSITVITDQGDMIFYDLLTGSTTKNSWLGTFYLDKDSLYKSIAEDNKTHFIATREAGEYAAKTYYLFHIAHRIIDYKNVKEQLGIVIVSIDGKMLESICNTDKTGNNFNFIVDHSGTMVSFKESNYLGKKIIDWSDDETVRKKRYLEFVTDKLGISQKFVSINVIYDESLDCDIINISNRNSYMNKLQVQRKIIFTVMIVALFLLMFLITGLTRNVMGSIRNLVETMKKIGKGELNRRAEQGKKVPAELNLIAEQFNSMIDKLQESNSKEKEANIKQRNAEIKALEAQINPHFLYNTLDTINWMAIDKNEYEISNSITCLAGILRYGIDKSNSVVAMNKEIEWLKQYLFLQQTRLKNSFECEISVDAEVENCRIHKLLFQPFIENAIIHGFDAKEGIHKLKVEIGKNENEIAITIWDNGCGIKKSMVDQMNQGYFPNEGDKNCIGMENAITRIRMYYGNRASVLIESEEGKYTRISILVPQGVAEDEICNS